MAIYEKVDEYKEDEEWVKYIERLTHYFTASKIEDRDKQRSILLSVCGAKTYKLIRVSQAFKNHRNAKPSEIVQRFIFNSRFCKEGEAISSGRIKTIN